MQSKSKNKKVSFKENVIYENDENDKREFREQLYDVDDYISLSNEELKTLLEKFNPKDFGITENLSISEKKIIIKDIYEKKNAKNDILNKKKINNNIVIKENGAQNDVLRDEVAKKDNLKSIDAIKINQLKKKNKKKNKESEKFMLNLDGDCYFPNDGYNYEQHLKSVSKNLIEIKSKNKSSYFNIIPNDEEEKEVYDALNIDNLEELNDNFIYEAQNVDKFEKLEIDDKLIWGNSDNILFLKNNEYLNDFNELKNRNIENRNNTECTDNLDEQSESFINIKVDCGDSNCNSNNTTIDNDKYIVYDEKLCSFSHVKSDHNIADQSKKDEKGHDTIKLSTIIEHELNNNKLNCDQMSSDKLNNEKKKKITKKKKKLKSFKINTGLVANINAQDKNKILEILNLQNDELTDDEENSFSEKSSGAISYDCETILTTKTNMTNHPYKLVIPKKIKPNSILNKISTREGEKKEKTEKKKTENNLIKLEHYLTLEKIKTVRDKNEAPEEKKQRKKAVKEAQRLNRKLKKENSILMKNEKKLMNKKNNPFDLRDNVKYVKL